MQGGDVQEGWMRQNDFAKYAGVGRSTVIRWFKMGLPFAKIGRTRLIHVDKADAWLEQFMVDDPSESIDSMVNDIMEDLQK